MGHAYGDVATSNVVKQIIKDLKVFSFWHRVEFHSLSIGKCRMKAVFVM